MLRLDVSGDLGPLPLFIAFVVYVRCKVGTNGLLML